jgi:hypothetical protein
VAGVVAWRNDQRAASSVPASNSSDAGPRQLSPGTTVNVTSSGAETFGGVARSVARTWTAWAPGSVNATGSSYARHSAPPSSEYSMPATPELSVASSVSVARPT